MSSRRRRAAITAVLLALLVAVVIYLRSTFDHHAWEWQWDVWIAFVVVTSVQLGWTLRIINSPPS